MRCVAARDSEGGRYDGGGAADLLSYLRLCVTPNDEESFLTALSTPTRTGFARSGAGVEYLRGVKAAAKSASVAPSGPWVVRK